MANQQMIATANQVREYARLEFNSRTDVYVVDENMVGRKFGEEKLVAKTRSVMFEFEVNEKLTKIVHIWTDKPISGAFRILLLDWEERPIDQAIMVHIWYNKIDRVVEVTNHRLPLSRDIPTNLHHDSVLMLGIRFHEISDDYLRFTSVILRTPTNDRDFIRVAKVAPNLTRIVTNVELRPKRSNDTKPTANDSQIKEENVSTETANAHVVAGSSNMRMADDVVVAEPVAQIGYYVPSDGHEPVPVYSSPNSACRVAVKHWVTDKTTSGYPKVESQSIKECTGTIPKTRPPLKQIYEEGFIVPDQPKLLSGLYLWCDQYGQLGYRRSHRHLIEAQQWQKEFGERATTPEPEEEVTPKPRSPTFAELFEIESEGIAKGLLPIDLMTKNQPTFDYTVDQAFRQHCRVVKQNLIESGELVVGVDSLDRKENDDIHDDS